MRVVFHGMNAGSFAPGFADLLEQDHHVAVLADRLEDAADRAVYAAADAIIGVQVDAACPAAAGLRLYQVPGAGYDAIDMARLPRRACAMCSSMSMPLPNT